MRDVIFRARPLPAFRKQAYARKTRVAQNRRATAGHVLPDRQRHLDRPDQVLDVDRLDEARDGAVRLGRRAQIPGLQAGRDDDGHIAVHRRIRCKQIHAGHARHPQIGQHDDLVGTATRAPAPRSRRRRHPRHNPLAKDGRQHLARVRIIVDHEDPCSGRHPASPVTVTPNPNTFTVLHTQ
jgi:hypothetical protein